MTAAEANAIIGSYFSTRGHTWIAGESLTVLEQDGRLYLTDAHTGVREQPLHRNINVRGIRAYARDWLDAVADHDG